MEKVELPNKSNYRKLGFSKAWYSGVPLYVREIPGNYEGIEAIGRNWFYSVLLDIVTWVNVNIRRDEGFIFKVLLECDTDAECPGGAKCVGNVCKPENHD